MRMLAWSELVRGLDLERYMTGPSGVLEKGSYLELLRDYLASDVQAFIRIGSDEIKAILKRLAAGESPEVVGILYTPEPAREVSKGIIKAPRPSDRGWRGTGRFG